MREERERVGRKEKGRKQEQIAISARGWGIPEWGAAWGEDLPGWGVLTYEPSAHLG